MGEPLRPEAARIGFAGLGKMGGPIATNLIEAGWRLTVWNRTRDKCEALAEKGASVAETPQALAAECDLVLTMLADGAAVEAVYLGEDGLLSGARSGLVAVDMSTIAPDQSRKISAAAGERGVRMLDAPVTGSPAVAAKGGLGMMIGGDADLIETVRPVLEIFTSTLLHAGGPGAGESLKLVNNLVMALAIEASAEALTLARKCGLDPKQVIDITSVGGAQMRTMQVRGPRMLDRDFKPAFTLDGMHKDLSAALDMAEAAKVTLPAATMALAMLRTGRAQGHGELDPAAVVMVVEALAGGVSRAGGRDRNWGDGLETYLLRRPPDRRGEGRPRRRRDAAARRDSAPRRA